MLNFLRDKYVQGDIYGSSIALQISFSILGTYIPQKFGPSITKNAILRRIEILIFFLLP